MKTCSVEGCEAKHYGKGLCWKHYRSQWRKMPQQKAKKNEKRRTERRTPGRAEEVRALDRAAYERRREYILGKAKERRDCPLRGPRLKAYKSEAYFSDPMNRVRAFDFAGKALGFTPEMTRVLFALQNGKCDICGLVFLGSGKHTRGLVRDHCHAPEYPRGLLCSICNKCLGLYENYQRPFGTKFAEYERYLVEYPVARLLRLSAEELAALMAVAPKSTAELCRAPVQPEEAMDLHPDDIALFFEEALEQ